MMTTQGSTGIENTAPKRARTSSGNGSLGEELNGRWHERAGYAFLAVVLFHWAEHLAQAFQVFALGWPRPEANGVLGLWLPWLVKSELLHYAYALVMLFGFWVLRPGYAGAARTWWSVALAIQFWHHIEHLLLQSQVLFAHNLFGSPVPTSLVQLWIPRVELHLFYNMVVFAPMVVAMYLHWFPSIEGAARQRCSCAYPLAKSAVVGKG